MGCAGSTPSGSAKITVRDIDGTIISAMEVPLRRKVGDVKREITEQAPQLGIEVGKAELHLVFRENTLEDRKSLAACGCVAEEQHEMTVLVRKLTVRKKRNQIARKSA